MTTIVTVERAAKHYLLGKTVVPALKGVDLSIHENEFLAICGPSGSGKTTLLHLIGCIEKPTAGKIWIDGIDTALLSDDELADIRADKISFVFQKFNLLPVLTALENVEYPLLGKNISARERRDRARQAMTSVNLSSHERHKPLELSGGQQQRVAIARAIVTEPRLILADEPTANLDHATGLGVLDLMKNLNQSRRTTFVFSTHDPMVMERASRLVTLWDGSITEARK